MVLREKKYNVCFLRCLLVITSIAACFLMGLGGKALMTESGKVRLKYLKIAPTEGIVNKTVFGIELVLEGEAKSVYIDYKDDDEGWGYNEYFFTNPMNRFTYERIFEKVAAREYRIYAQDAGGAKVLLHSGVFRIKNTGSETGVYEIHEGSDAQALKNLHADGAAVPEDAEAEQECKNTQNGQIEFSVYKVVPECICLKQKGPVSFLVSGSSIRKDSGARYTGSLYLDKEKIKEFPMNIENDSTLSFNLQDFTEFKEGVYSLEITSNSGVSRILDSSIVMVSEMNICRFEIGRIVVEADAIIDCADKPETKTATGNVRINGQILSTSDVEINTRYKSLKGDGKLYINCTGYTTENTLTPFTICDEGGFSISATTGEIKVDNSEKFAYLAGNKFEISTYEITKDEGLNIRFKLFDLADMLKVLIQDSESLKYLPNVKKLSVSANIRNNVFKIVTDIEGKIPTLFKLSGIKLLKFFEFGDLQFRYDSGRDLFTSEAVVKIGNSKSKFLPQIPQLQLIGGIAIMNGKAGINKIAGKAAGLNAPIDSTGIFFHSLEIGAQDMFTGPFIIDILSELTAGPKVKILSKNYSLLSIYDAGMQLDITNLEAALTGKLKFLNFDSEQASCKAAISYRNGATVEGNVNLCIINGKLYAWFKSRDDFGGRITGSFNIPQSIPIVGGKTVSDAEFILENSEEEGLYAHSNINLWKNISFNAAYYFQKNELKVATNLFGKKIGSAASLRYRYTPVYASLENVPAVIPENCVYDCVYVDIPPGTGEALIRIMWDGEDADFKLTLPDGRVVTPDQAAGENGEFYYLKNASANEASYLMDKPAEGQYLVSIARGYCTNVRVEVYDVNRPPEVEYLEVEEFEENKAVIKWKINDDDAGHAVSLYYDKDGSGYDGKPVIEDMTADFAEGSFEWNTTGLLEDNYYIYMKVQDGVNAPVLKYSGNSVETGGAMGLPAPKNLSAYSNGAGLYILWDEVPGDNIAGYIVEVFQKGSTAAVKDIACYENQCVFDNIERGQMYIVRVRCMDTDCNESNKYAEYEVFHSERKSERVELKWPYGDEVADPYIEVAGLNPDETLLCVKLNGQAICELRDREFSIPVRLREGVNYIFLEAIDEGVVELLQQKKVILDSTPPFLKIRGINDGYQTFEDSIELGIDTDAEYLYINGKLTEQDNETGSVIIPLKTGENVIAVSASDGRGTARSEILKVYRLDKTDLSLRYYSDINNHWAREYIERMRDRNIMFDRGFKEFFPDKPVYRSEVAAFMVNLLKLEEGEGLQPFEDVTSANLFREHIIKAYNNGIIAGYNGRYFPDDSITRQDLCIVLNNVLNFLGIDCKQGDEKDFRDSAAISAYARDAVDAVCKSGLIKGKPGDIFDPLGNATRAETAVVLERLMGVLEEEVFEF